MRLAAGVTVAVFLVARGWAAEAGSTSTVRAALHYFDDDAIVWREAPPTMPPGASVTAPMGDPRTGASTMMLKIPKGYTLKPHRHGADEAGVVVSGWLQAGEGESADPATSERLGPGDWVHIPAGTPHWVTAVDDCVLVLFSYGPRTTLWVNPADDPAKSAPAPTAK